MLDIELPNELILIAAQAIADSRCGKMRFSMLDSAEWQVLIELDSSIGNDASDVYFIVRSQPQKPLQYVVANSYCGCVDQPEKPLVFLENCIIEAIEHFRELEAL